MRNGFQVEEMGGSRLTANSYDGPYPSTQVHHGLLRSVRLGQFARLFPQYPTALGASVLQPLFRGRARGRQQKQWKERTQRHEAECTSFGQHPFG
jgi:hypothetical protein